MIIVYKTRYMQPAATLSARFKVTCINTLTSRIVAYNHGVSNPAKDAINTAFGEETYSIECIGDCGLYDTMYAVNQ